jgi:mechanosensitive ion channel-like protein
MPTWLQDGLATIARFVPQLVLFLVILVIGWIVAKLLRKVVGALLVKIGFDRAVERSGVGGKVRDSKYRASDVAALVVYYAVLLFALQLAFGVFGPNPVSGLIAGIVAFLPKLFIALVIVVVGAAIAGAVADLIRGAAGGLGSARIMATAAQVFIIALAVIAALNQMGIAITVTMPVLITALATAGGIAVVGVGGGLIVPMRQRWERWLTAAERETARAREQGRAPAPGSVPEPRSPEEPATASVPPPVDAQSR